MCLFQNKYLCSIQINKYYKKRTKTCKNQKIKYVYVIIMIPQDENELKVKKIALYNYQNMRKIAKDQKT